jgi:D-alanyl-D-alanine carboxypeptidase
VGGVPCLSRLAGAWRVASRAGPSRVRVVESALPAPVSARLERAVAGALAGVPGAQVAVRRGGTPIWSAHAGRVDRVRDVERDDRFVLASATKPVTATLVALLAERGALDLDAPVAGWLPELPHAGRLTPRLLLSHRSGLREYARDPAVGRRLNGGDPGHAWTRAEVIEAIVRLGAERLPGGRFAYRNSNFVVAAEIAERAGGRDVEALLTELVARPLGLSGLSFAPAVDGARLAGPHLALLGRAVDRRATPSGRCGATAAWRAAPPRSRAHGGAVRRRSCGRRRWARWCRGPGRAGRPTGSA